MNRKTYTQPSMKVKHLEITDMVCGSPDDPANPYVFEVEVEDYDLEDRKGVPREVWGAQW